MGGKRPWINDDGSRKSDAEISRLGQFWDEKTWEKFLDEEVGKITRSGRLARGVDLDEFSEDEFRIHKREFSHGVANLNLAAVFQAAFQGLNPKERFVLKRYFWDESKLKDIAEEMGISPSTVRTVKGRAVKKLNGILSSKEFVPKLARELKKRKYANPQKNNGGIGLKKEVLDFIKDNLPRLLPLEKRAAECLYLRQMTLKNTATALDKTVGGVMAIRRSTFDRLEKIYKEGYEKNREPSQEAS